MKTVRFDGTGFDLGWWIEGKFLGGDGRPLECLFGSSLVAGGQTADNLQTAVEQDRRES